MKMSKRYDVRYNPDKYVTRWKLISPYILGFCVVGLAFAGTILIMAFKESIDFFVIPQPVVGWFFITAPLVALGYWTFRKIKEINNQDHLNH